MACRLGADGLIVSNHGGRAEESGRGTVADVVQSDNRRAGGPTEWIEIAAIADGFGVELASHGGGPANMNILCAIPNAIYMESDGKEKLVNGEVLAPEAPGLSSEPAGDFIAKYKVG